MMDLYNVLTTYGTKENGFILIVIVFLSYLIKKRQGELDYISKSHKSIISANEEFRQEVKADLELVRKEKNELIRKVEFLEEKLFHLGQENVALKKREMELTQEIRELKSHIMLMTIDCEKTDCAIIRQFKKKIEGYEREISRL